jgi:hypothetical protein
LVTCFEKEKLDNDMDLGYALLIFEKNVEMNKLPPKV